MIFSFHWEADGSELPQQTALTPFLAKLREYRPGLVYRQVATSAERGLQMRIMSVLGVIVLCLAVLQSLSATDAPTKVIDFLFSEDNQIATTEEQLNATIENKEILRNNKWWNESLERLDYALMTIEEHLNSSNPVKTLILKDASKYFDRSTDSSLLIPPFVSFIVRYFETSGRLVLRADVQGAGKPKKPMKQFCELVLTRVKHSYSLKPLGHAWRGALGVLYRDDNSRKYNGIVQKLAESAVLRAEVSTYYKNNGIDEGFIVGCMQQDADGPVTFSSARLRLRPNPADPTR